MKLFEKCIGEKEVNGNIYRIYINNTIFAMNLKIMFEYKDVAVDVIMIREEPGKDYSDILSCLDIEEISEKYPDVITCSTIMDINARGLLLPPDNMGYITIKDLHKKDDISDDILKYFIEGIIYKFYNKSYLILISNPEDKLIGIVKDIGFIETDNDFLVYEKNDSFTVSYENLLDKLKG